MAAVGTLALSWSVPSAGAAETPPQFGDCGVEDAAAVSRDIGWGDYVERRLGSNFENAGFAVTQAFCAELTGDEVRELVLLAQCCTVSSPTPWAIFMASPDGGVRTAFTAIRNVSYVRRLRRRGGTRFPRDIIESRSLLWRTDASCCPTGGRLQRFIRWDGRRFRVAERVYINRRCGPTRFRFRIRGIRATRTRCSSARRIARRFVRRCGNTCFRAQRHRVRRYRCRSRFAGSYVAVRCTRGRRLVRFRFSPIAFN